MADLIFMVLEEYISILIGMATTPTLIPTARVVATKITKVPTAKVMKILFGKLQIFAE